MVSLSTPTRKHDISFFPDGRIDLSAYAAKALDLAPGDVIDIARHGAEWLLYPKLRRGTYAGCHRGQLYATAKRRGASLRAWSRPLAAAAIAAEGCSPLRCPCGETAIIDGILCLTIIHHCHL